MNQDLQSNLFTACPLLYKHFKGNQQMQIDCPDDTDTLRKILGFAEKRAIVPQDHSDLANWYKKYLNIDKAKEVDNAIL